MSSGKSLGVGVKLDPIFSKPSSELFRSKDILIEGSVSQKALLETKDPQESSYGNWTKGFSHGTKSQNEQKDTAKNTHRAKSLATTGGFSLGPAGQPQTVGRKQKKNDYRDLTRMFNSLDITVVRNNENRKLTPLLQPNSRAALTGAFKSNGWTKTVDRDGGDMDKQTNTENSGGYRRLLRTQQAGTGFMSDLMMVCTTKTVQASSQGVSRTQSRDAGVPHSSSSQRRPQRVPVPIKQQLPNVPKLNMAEVNPEFAESKELIIPIKVQEGVDVTHPNTKPAGRTISPFETKNQIASSEDLLDFGEAVRDEMSPLSPAKPIGSISSRKMRNNLADSFAPNKFEVSPRELSKPEDSEPVEVPKKVKKPTDISKLFSQGSPTGGVGPSHNDLMDLNGVRSALNQILKKEMMVDAKRPFLETLTKPRAREVKYYLSDVKAQSDMEETFRVSQQPNGPQQLGFSPVPSWMKASTVGSKGGKSGSKNLINTSIMGSPEGEGVSPGLKASKLYNINASQGPYANSGNKPGSKPGSKMALASLKEVQYLEIDKAKIKHLVHFQSLFKQLR